MNWDRIVAGISLSGMLSLAVAGGVYKEKVDDMEDVQSNQQVILLEQRTLQTQQTQVQEDLKDIKSDLKDLIREIRQSRSP